MFSKPNSSYSSSSSNSYSSSSRSSVSTISSIYKQFGGYNKFAQSYGLRPGEDDENIRAIAEEMGIMKNNTETI